MLLRYESPTKVYGISVRGAYCLHQDGKLTITESFKDSARYDSIEKNLGEYKVICRARCASLPELMANYRSILEATREIDVAWLYSCGHPLAKEHYTLLSPSVLMYDGTIKGWKTNYRSIRKKMHYGKPRVDFSISRVDHAHLETYPLQSALSACEAIRHAGATVRALIELYYSARKVADTYSVLFFMSKALEMVRKILPGKNDAEKEQSLAAKCSIKLPISLHQMYDLANNRFETRHAIARENHVRLMPHITNEELRTFLASGDDIIRAVVCAELGVQSVRVAR